MNQSISIKELPLGNEQDFIQYVESIIEASKLSVDKSTEQQLRLLCEECIKRELKNTEIYYKLRLRLIGIDAMLGRFDEASNVIEEILNNCNAPSLLYYKGQAFYIMGAIKHNQSKYTECIHYSNKALEIFIPLEQNDQLCTVLNNKAASEAHLGFYEKSLISFYKAYSYAKKTNKTEIQSTLYFNIISILILQKRLDLAEKELNKFDQFFTQKADKKGDHGIIWYYFAKAEYLQAIDQHKQSIEYTQLALEHIEKSKYYFLIPVATHMATEAYIELKDYKQAFNIATQTLEVGKQHQSTDAIFRAYTAFAKILISVQTNQTSFWDKPILNEFDGKLSNLIQKIEEVEGTLNRAPEKVTFFRLLSQYYKKIENYQQALKYTEKLLIEESKTYKIQTNDTIFRLQEEFSSKQKEQEIQFQQQLLDKQKQINQNLERFAHTVSHDMREPLRMISNFGQLLKEEQILLSSKEKKQYLEYIINSSKQLTKLVRDLLEYSKLDLTNTEAQAINLKNIIDIVLLNLKEGIAQSKAQINLPSVFPDLKVHPVLIIQLFQNLLHNALKFVETGKMPVISLEIKEDVAEKTYVFSVVDNGIGIPEKNFDKLFKTFSRLHSKSKYPGSGIGLASCKKVVDFYEGKIWVTSEVNKGTSFNFTLPKTNVHY